MDDLHGIKLKNIEELVDVKAEEINIEDVHREECVSSHCSTEEALHIKLNPGRKFEDVEKATVDSHIAQKKSALHVKMKPRTKRKFEDVEKATVDSDPAQKRSDISEEEVLKKVKEEVQKREMQEVKQQVVIQDEDVIEEVVIEDEMQEVVEEVEIEEEFPEMELQEEILEVEILDDWQDDIQDVVILEEWQEEMQGKLQEVEIEDELQTEIQEVVIENELQAEIQELEEADKYYKCTSCAKSYRSLLSLDRHRKIECGKQPSQLCHLCSYMTKQSSNLTRHLALRHNLIPYDEARSHAYQSRICYKCGSTFKTKNSLDDHLRYTCGQKPNRICPYCDYKSLTPSQLNAHLKRVHSVTAIRKSRSAVDSNISQLRSYRVSGGGYKCPKCEKVIQCVYGLRRHLVKVCGQAKIEFCTFCSFQCSFKSSLRRHLSKIHQLQ